MAKSMIPMRPEGFAASSLNQDEQSALTWMVLSGCTRRDAYITFARPDMLNSRAQAAIDEYVKQFFSRKDVKEYLVAYEATLDKFLNPAKELKPFAPDLSMEERKAKSKEKLTEFSMSLIQNIDQAKDPEMVMKLADKIGLLDVDEKAPEEPRRYLPVQCGQCAYRQFCEDNTEDMCPHCKYLKECEAHGIHFDKQEMLDIQIKTEDEK